MNTGNQTFRGVREVEDWLLKSNLLADSLVPALYVSANRDTKPLTFLHPEFLNGQSGVMVPAPNFFVFIDAKEIENDIVDYFYFEDCENGTRIEAADLGEANLLDKKGRLVSVTWESPLYRPSRSVIWVLSCTNDWFTRFALTEGWQPTWFVGVGDGCPWQLGDFGEFGQPCVNALDNVEVSIPVQLGASYWVTDHVIEASLGGEKLRGGEDPKNGDMLIPEDQTSGVTLTQIASLSGLFGCETTPSRFRGGARLFAIDVPE